MIQHKNKEHCATTARVVQECTIYDEDFHSSYILREHEQMDHGAQKGLRAQTVDVTQILDAVDDINLKEKL